MKLNKLLSVRGQDFERFCEKVNELRPDMISEDLKEIWKRIKDDKLRSIEINDYLSYRRFTNKDFITVNKYVFKVRVPKNLPWVILLLVGAGYIGFMGWQFSRLQVVYTYGNNVMLYEAPDSSAIKNDQLDIYGEKISGDSAMVERSRETMLLLDSSTAWVKVAVNNFIQWFPGLRKEYFIKKEELLFSRAEYDTYKSLFTALKGGSELAGLDNKLRRMILHLTQADPSRYNAVLAGDYPERFEKAGYSKILVTSPVQDTSYLFLRFFLGNGAKNFVSRFDDAGIIDTKELTDNNRQPLSHPGLFKEQKTVSMAPDILFFDLTTRREIQSVRTPYQRFNPN